MTSRPALLLLLLAAAASTPLACGASEDPSSPAAPEAGADDAGVVDRDADHPSQRGDAFTPADAAPVDAREDVDASSAFCAAVATCPIGGASCAESEQCLYRLMLPAAAALYLSCRTGPSCTGGLGCENRAAKTIEPSGTTTYLQDCVARLGACPEAYDPLLCSPRVFAYPGVGAAAQACLAQACGDIGACLATALGDVAACDAK